MRDVDGDARDNGRSTGCSARLVLLVFLAFSELFGAIDFDMGFSICRRLIWRGALHFNAGGVGAASSLERMLALFMQDTNSVSIHSH